MATTKKLCFTGPSYLLPEQFYQPGDCEEAGWPDVTHIVASAFEGPSSPLSPEMGWLNRFSVFTAGLPPSAHFNLSNNKRWTERLGVSQTMDEFFIKWLNWVACGTIFIHRSSFIHPIGKWAIQWGLCGLDVPFPVLAKAKQDDGIPIYMSSPYFHSLCNRHCGPIDTEILEALDLKYRNMLLLL